MSEFHRLSTLSSGSEKKRGSKQPQSPADEINSSDDGEEAEEEEEDDFADFASLSFRAPEDIQTTWETTKATPASSSNILQLDGGADILGSSSSDFITIQGDGWRDEELPQDGTGAAGVYVDADTGSLTDTGLTNVPLLRRNFSLSRDPRHYSAHGVPRQSLPLLAFSHETGNSLLEKRTDSYNEALGSPLDLDFPEYPCVAPSHLTHPPLGTNVASADADC